MLGGSYHKMLLYKFIKLMLVAPVDFFQRDRTIWMKFDCLCVRACVRVCVCVCFVFVLTFSMIWIIRI